MMNRVILTVSIALIFTVILISGCGKEEVEVKEEIRVPVVVSNPTVGTVHRNYRTTGTIEAEDESILSFPTGGRLISLAVDAGDNVVAGQELAKVDSVQYREAVNAARAAYGAASDGIKARETGLNVAKNQLSDARNRFGKIEADYLRFKVLYEDEVVTKKEFEDIETAYKSAKLGIESAEDGVRAAELQVEIAKGQADAAAARKDQAVKMLADAVLYAPYSGIISEKMMEIGELAGPGMPVFRLTGGGQRKVILKIPEEYYGKIEVGDEVEIDLDYLPEPITAEVLKITPDVSKESRTFTIEVPIPVEYKSLPGSFAQVKMVLERAEGTMTIPLSAILSFEDRHGVFLNVEGVAKRKIITIGLIEGETAQVLDGLSWDDQVVVVGNRFLNEGALLEVTTTTESVDEKA